MVPSLSVSIRAWVSARRLKEEMDFWLSYGPCTVESEKILRLDEAADERNGTDRRANNACKSALPRWYWLIWDCLGMWVMLVGHAALRMLKVLRQRAAVL